MQEVADREEKGAAPEFKGIPTRQSLLSRLKNWNDHESWKVFFDTYWRLIYNTAIKAGLNDAQAQDVVQETVISTLKSMPSFQYDPSKGSFKAWLLCVTQRRIVDQLRKRRRSPGEFQQQPFDGLEDYEPAQIESIPDPGGQRLEAIWDAEWEQNLMAAALERIKARVDLNHYQIFELYVVKGRKVSDIARVMHVHRAQIYLIKHRIQKLLKEEFERIRNQPI